MVLLEWSAAAMRSMVDDVASLCLVKECKELEEGFGPQFTDNLRGYADQINLKEVKKVIGQLDREKRIAKGRLHRLQQWQEMLRLLDTALDLELRHTTSA